MIISGENEHKRVLCYSVTGRVKTTFAKKLGEVSGLKFHEVDQLTWLPDWVQVLLELQREKISEVCDQDSWILDSAYGKWLDIPFERVTLIIGVSYLRHTSLFRLLIRACLRAFNRGLVCNGNRETWKNFFKRDSIIGWHFKSFYSEKKGLKTLQS